MGGKRTTGWGEKKARKEGTGWVNGGHEREGTCEMGRKWAIGLERGGGHG